MPSIGIPVTPFTDPILRKYESLAQWQRGMLGAATAYEAQTHSRPVLPPFQFAACQEYQGGAIYWNYFSSETHLLLGTYGKWKETGRANGPLGRPTQDETPAGDNRGAFTRFENGLICWSPQTGFCEVHGPIASKYEARSLTARADRAGAISCWG